jgi:arginase
MEVELLLVPYDSAQRGVGLGAGPERMVAAGLIPGLARAGHQVVGTTVLAPPPGRVAEIRTAFGLMAALAGAVRTARAAGHFPLVLAGNCNTCIGTVAGLGGGSETAVLWFDAHGDFNTPETTTSAFLDGMALATLTGRCWTKLARAVDGFTPVPESAACLLGTRDVDPAEADAIARSSVRLLPARRIAAELPALLAGLAPRVRRAYLHLDLDVLDPSEGQPNEFVAADGLSVAELSRAVGTIGHSVPVEAATLSAYDPSYDADGRIGTAAVTLAQAIVMAAAAQGSGFPR